jgi:hypothetical protein
MNSPAALRDMHRVNSNTFKVYTYSSFKRIFGAGMSLTTVGHKAHAFHRRVNVKAITTAAIRGFEYLVMTHIDTFIQIIGEGRGRVTDGEEGWSTTKDMSNSVAFYITNIMGSVTFGQTWKVQLGPLNGHFVKDLPNGKAGTPLVSGYGGRRGLGFAM